MGRASAIKPSRKANQPQVPGGFPMHSRVFGECSQFIALASLLVFVFLFATPSAPAQNAGPLLITQNVNESELVTLEGNTRPEARAKYDRGPVDDSFLMEHLFLLLRRSPDRERELDRFISNLHDSSSPIFHQWLTANEFGDRFGVEKQDRDAVKNWLESHGFKVNVDYTNGLLIDFSGTAGQIRDAFR